VISAGEDLARPGQTLLPVFFRTTCADSRLRKDRDRCMANTTGKITISMNNTCPISNFTSEERSADIEDLLGGCGV
jgi:hypothetical protein